LNGIMVVRYFAELSSFGTLLCMSHD